MISAAIRAAMHSRGVRIWYISSTWSRLSCETKLPRCGTTAIKPSAARRPNASRIGVRLNPSRSATRASVIRSRGRRTPVRIARLISWYGDVRASPLPSWRPGGQDRLLLRALVMGGRSPPGSQTTARRTFRAGSSRQTGPQGSPLGDLVLGPRMRATIFQQTGPVRHRAPTQVDSLDLANVADGPRWIPSDDHHVGELARLEAADQLVAADGKGGPQSARFEGRQRSPARAREELHLHVCRFIEARERGASVRANDHPAPALAEAAGILLAHRHGDGTIAKPHPPAGGLTLKCAVARRHRGRGGHPAVGH